MFNKTTRHKKAPQGTSPQNTESFPCPKHQPPLQFEWAVGITPPLTCCMACPPLHLTALQQCCAVTDPKINFQQATDMWKVGQSPERLLVWQPSDLPVNTSLQAKRCDFAHSKPDLTSLRNELRKHSVLVVVLKHSALKNWGAGRKPQSDTFLSMGKDFFTLNLGRWWAQQKFTLDPNSHLKI